MLPPALPISSSNASALLTLSPSRGTSPETSRNGSIVPRKSAGFKPIGQQSSAVKRFFPGDEDEDEDEDEDQPTLSAPAKLPTSPVRSAKPRFVPAQAEPPCPPYPSSRPGERAGSRSPGHTARTHDRDYRDGHTRSPRPFTPRVPPIQRHHATQEDFKLPPYEDDRPSVHSMMPMGHYPPLSTPSMTRLSSPRGTRDEYEIVSQVGEGTFGKVYKARNTSTGAFVALKRIRMEAERDGFPVTAMREIKLLQSLRHDNVVRLYEMMVAGSES